MTEKILQSPKTTRKPKKSLFHRDRMLYAIAAVTITVFALSGCNNFVLKNVLDGKNTVPLAISPGAVTILVGESFSFSASGGVPPYTYSVTAGCGVVTPGTSEFVAPGTPETGIVRVTDSVNGTREAEINVVAFGPLSISPVGIMLELGESVTFSAAGGDPSYTYSIVAGGGAIGGGSGVFTAPLTPQTVTVRVTDSSSNTDDAAVDVVSSSPLSISPSSVSLVVGSGITFSATGGVPPYQYFITVGGESIGLNTGVYNAPGTADNVTVQVQDSLSNTSDAAVTVTDPPPGPVTINPTGITLDVLEVFNFSATGGTPSYSYSIEVGGGSIVAGTGQYTASSSPDNVTVRVTDSLSNTSDAAVTVIISNPVTIGPSSVTLEIGEVFTFSASGGYPLYSYSVETGTGSIIVGTGQYTAPNSPDNVTIRVTDNIGGTSEATVTVVAPPLAINPPAVTMNVNNTITFSVTGGVTPYDYSIFAGGGSIIAATGVYTAPPFSDNVTIRVTDDIGITSNAAVTVVMPVFNVDYVISSFNFPAGGKTTTALSGDFEVQNQGTADGTQPVSWYVYLSQDSTIGDGDVIIDSGSFAPLNASATTATIPFSGFWPKWYGGYHLIIDVAALDDDALPNTQDSGAIPITLGKTGNAAETELNGNWHPTAPQDYGWGWAAQANDFDIVLEPGSIITISGNMEDDSADIYKFNTGTAVTMYFSCTWGEVIPLSNDHDDCIDLVVYDIGGVVLGVPHSYADFGYEVIADLPVVETTGPAPGPYDYTGLDLYLTVGNAVTSGWNPYPGSDRAYILVIKAY